MLTPALRPGGESTVLQVNGAIFGPGVAKTRLALASDRQSSRRRARELADSPTERELERLGCVNRTQARLLAHDAGIAGR